MLHQSQVSRAVGVFKDANASHARSYSDTEKVALILEAAEPRTLAEAFAARNRANETISRLQRVSV
jgi:hypothetical protein